MERIIFNLFKECFKKFTGDVVTGDQGSEINEGEILNQILNEGSVEKITEWADKNKDKLDKCMVIQTGKWFSKGQTGTRPDGSIKEFDGPHVMVQAVLFSRVEIVRILQQKGGRLDYRREKGDTALIEAVHVGNLELAKFILASPEIEDKKGYVNIVGEGGMTAVFHACTEHNKDAKCLEWLIEQGANIEHRANEVGFSALHYAAVTNTSGAQIQVLLAAGLPIDTSLHNPGGHTALHSAAESKCLKTAATLISAGISPYTKNSNGETPVSIAWAKYPQVYTNILTFGTQFKELAESMTSNNNPMH